MIARAISEHVEHGWIRRMYTEGIRMKAERGEENVFDYSLGNPVASPPRAVSDALRKLAAEQPQKRGHGYMPNAGHMAVRQTVAESLQRRTGLPYDASHIIMTVGAAGAVNVALKSILNPGDEVIVPMPCFAEYPFYIGNHGGVMKPVETTVDFQLDTEAIGKALTSRTKAILLNTPNNPTGAVYTAGSLQRLDKVVAQHDQPVLVISDEPYRELVYGNVAVPEMPALLTRCAVAYSWSKSFGLAGERIGYLALSPKIPEAEKLIEACIFANRVLGFVSAPSIWQWVISEVIDAPAALDEYEEKIDLICSGLQKIGYQLIPPSGGFYVYPQTPIADDMAFVKALQKEGILTVPGSSFGRSGHIRLSMTISKEKVERSLPGFEKAFHAAG